MAHISVRSMQLKNSIVLAKRGDCAFTTKAKIAESGGAAGLIVINDDEGIASCMPLTACYSHQTN